MNKVLEAPTDDLQQYREILDNPAFDDWDAVFGDNTEPQPTETVLMTDARRRLLQLTVAGVALMGLGAGLTSQHEKAPEATIATTVPTVAHEATIFTPQLEPRRYAKVMPENADQLVATKSLSELEASPELTDFIPAKQLEMYYHAAQEFDVDWRDVAMIVWIENGLYVKDGFHSIDPDSTDWPVSPGQARGPAQFIDSTARLIQQKYPQLAGIDYSRDFDGSIRMLAALHAANGGKTKSPTRLALLYNAGPSTKNFDGVWYYQGKPWDPVKQREINRYLEEAQKFHQRIDDVLTASF